MGYTQHWKYRDSFNTGAWTGLCEDVDRLAKCFPYPLHSLASDRPLIDREVIHINPGDCGVEHFRLTAEAMAQHSYCKTEWTPFDRMVCAILALAAMRNASLVILSDGDAGDWEPHIAWAAGVLRRPIAMPAFAAEL